MSMQEAKSEPLTVADAIASAKIGFVQIGTFVLCAAVMLIDGLDNFVIGFVAPYFVKDWGLSTTQVTTIFTLSAVALAIGYFSGGAVADRIGRRPVVIGALVLMGASCLMTSVARGFEDMVLWRIVTGLSLGMAIPNAVALMVEFAPGRFRGSAAAILFGIYGAGAAIAGIITQILVPTHGWQSVFVAGGIAPLVVAVLCLAVLPESILSCVARGKNLDRAEKLLLKMGVNEKIDWQALRRLEAQRPPAPSIRELFQEGRSGITILLWILFAVNILEISLFSVWLPLIIKSADQPVEIAIRATTLFQTGTLIGSILIGIILAYRIKISWVLLFWEVLGTISVALLGNVMGWPTAMFVLACTVGIVLGMVTGGANGICATFYPTRIRSTGIGTALACGRLSGTLGPVLGGVLMGSKVSLPILFLLCSLPMFIGSIAVVLLFWFSSANAEAGIRREAYGT